MAGAHTNGWASTPGPEDERSYMPESLLAVAAQELQPECTIDVWHEAAKRTYFVQATEPAPRHDPVHRIQVPVSEDLASGNGWREWLERTLGGNYATGYLA